MKGMIFLWGILLVLTLALLLFAGDRLYGIAQMVAQVVGGLAARLQAVIGSLV